MRATPTPSRSELLEIHDVVEHLTGIVEEAAVGLLDDLSDGKPFESAAGEEAVEVVDIGLEVLAMVEAEGVTADDAKGGWIVGELHELELVVYRIDFSHGFVV